LATTSVDRDFIDVIAGEITLGVNAAVNGWISEFESILEDSSLTTLGKLQAIHEVVARYRSLNTSGEQLECERQAMN
jgi:hypothetical protein